VNIQYPFHGLFTAYLFLAQGHVGVASIEELELAINNIKLMILEAEEHSTARRELVNKLVELRLKLAEAKVRDRLNFYGDYLHE
jgi:cell fate regulator YaaT (PSP1 superfamily)